MLNHAACKIVKTSQKKTKGRQCLIVSQDKTVEAQFILVFHCKKSNQIKSNEEISLVCANKKVFK